MELPGRREDGRWSRRRLLDVMKEETQRAVTEEDAMRTGWGGGRRCDVATPEGSSQKKILFPLICLEFNVPVLFLHKYTSYGEVKRKNLSECNLPFPVCLSHRQAKAHESTLHNTQHQSVRYQSLQSKNWCLIKLWPNFQHCLGAVVLTGGKKIWLWSCILIFGF